MRVLFYPIWWEIIANTIIGATIPLLRMMRNSIDGYDVIQRLILYRLEDRNFIIQESKLFSLYDDDDLMYWILGFNSKQLL